MTDEWTLPRDLIQAHTPPGSNLAFVQITGNSMNPDFRHGDRVLVDLAWKNPTPPGFYVLWDGLGLVVKQVELLIGSSPPRVRINSSYPDYAVYEQPLEDVHIIGRVVARWDWT